MSNYQLFFKKLTNKIYEYPVSVALILSALLILCCSMVLAFELNISLMNAFIQVLPLFLGELGGVEWESDLAKFAGTVGLIAGVIFIAIVGARIVSAFVNISLQGGRIMKKVNYKNHIIICGWNIQGKNIVKQLLSPDIAETRPIVILAKLLHRPIKEDRVDFISGDPTSEEDLKKAGIMSADTVIILTEFNYNSDKNVNPDAQAVLITLTVETLRRDVYTVVQLFSSEYKKHLENAHVDEYICLDRLASNLMVSSALNHGVSWILNELLEFTSGSEFYKKRIPEQFVGMRFRKVANILNMENMVLMAVETKIQVPRFDEEGNKIFDSHGKVQFKTEEKLIINPQTNEYPKDYVFKKGDSIFLLAVEEPTAREMKKIAERAISSKV